MAIKDWSTTAANNDDADASINWLENQAPSSVNNSARSMMAVIRTWYEDVEWRDWGHTVTRTGNTTFTIATDVTAIYLQNRPIRCADSSTLYGYIASSSYSAPNTTVTVTLDSGNLSASLTGVALGADPSKKPIHVTSVRNAVSSTDANTFTADQTISSTDAGATVGPNLILDRNSASPADADVLGAVVFRGRDDGGGTDTYAQIQAEAPDTGAGSEDGQISFQTKVAGTLATRGYVAQGVVVGPSATGGDKGAGTVNVDTNYYLDGSLIGKVDVQEFDTAGTWTKPTDYPSTSLVIIDMWGAGGSGACRSGGGIATGGGGGSYKRFIFRLSDLSATETPTPGAGGAAVSGSNVDGNNGGNTTFTVGSRTLTVYGGARGVQAAGGNNVVGGAGAGVLGAGTTASTSSSVGGNPRIDPATGNFECPGLGGRDGTTGAGADNTDGGAAGGGVTSGNAASNGGSADNGGAGGGSTSNTTSGTGGTCRLTGATGGNGARGGSSATDGQTPGCGGGGVSGAGTSGAGGAGRVRVRVFAAA